MARITLKFIDTPKWVKVVMETEIDGETSTYPVMKIWSEFVRQHPEIRQAFTRLVKLVGEKVADAAVAEVPGATRGKVGVPIELLRDLNAGGFANN